jgi:hypothetical protein
MAYDVTSTTGFTAVAEYRTFSPVVGLVRWSSRRYD